MRKPNTTTLGILFPFNNIEYVWTKATIVQGYNSGEFRQDACGTWIKFSDYGNTNSQYGWEIDHIQPVSKGGSDHLLNLQPLQWQNNRYKSDKYPWNCMI
jgi:hypothetical protein